MKTIIFIHGGESFSTQAEYLDWIKNIYPEWMLDQWEPKEEKTDWKTSIAEQSTMNGDVVYMPQFPNKLNAKYSEWKLFFDAWIQKISISDEVIFIGNSLGGCFLMKYFSGLLDFPYPISQVHLIAACIEAGDFTPSDNYEFLQQLGNRFHIWHAEDDTVVPFAVGQKLSEILPNAETHFFLSERGYGHFHGVERITELEKEILI